MMFRPAKATDLNLILDSWLRSYAKSLFARGIPANVFWEQHGELVRTTLSRCKVTVAHPEEDEDAVFGWIATETPNTIHYLWVRDSQRHPLSALANDLLAQTGLDEFTITHKTEHVEKRLRLWEEDNSIRTGTCPRCKTTMHRQHRDNPDEYIWTCQCHRVLTRSSPTTQRSPLVTYNPYLFLKGTP